MTNREKLVWLIGACVIFGLSVIPRFYDIYKFLPYYSIDENEIVEFAVSFVGGNLDPHWYKYGPLYAYILSLVYYVQSLFSGMGVDRYMQDIFFTPTHFYYTARFVNSLLNLFLGYLTFLIANRFFAKRVAYIALILAIFPFFDSLVYFKIRVDTLLAVWITLSLFFCLYVYEKGDVKSYRLSGLFFGLALATKPLPALLLLPTLFLAHYFRTVFILQSQDTQKDTRLKKQKKRRKKAEPARISVSRVLTDALFQNKIWQLFGVALLVAIIANPYSLLNLSGFVNEQVMALKTEGERAFLPGWNITRFFGQTGMLFVLSAIFSLIYYTFRAFRIQDKKLLILVSFPIIFWLAFARGAARNYFYVPMLPVLILLISMGIGDLADLITKKSRRSVSWIFVSLILVLLLLFPAIRLTEESIKMNSADKFEKIQTEFAATEWIKKNIEQRSKILLYGIYVSLPRLVDFDPNQQAQFGEYFMYSRWKNEYLKNLFIKAHRRYVTDGNPVYDLENIRSRMRSKEHLLYNYCVTNKFQYLVTNFNLSPYRELADGLVQQFTDRNYPFGSDIYIYRIKGNSK